MKPKKSELTLDLDSLSIAERFVAIRFYAGMNQHDMASMLKVSQGTISKLEHGIIEPSLATLVELRQWTGVTLDGFIDNRILYPAIAEKTKNHSALRPDAKEKLAQMLCGKFRRKPSADQ